MTDEIIQTVTITAFRPPRVVGEIPTDCMSCKNLQCFVKFPERTVDVYTYKCNHYPTLQGSCKHYEMIDVFPGLKCP